MHRSLPRPAVSLGLRTLALGGALCLVAGLATREARGDGAEPTPPPAPGKVQGEASTTRVFEVEHEGAAVPLRVQVRTLGGAAAEGLPGDEGGEEREHVVIEVEDEDGKPLVRSRGLRLERQILEHIPPQWRGMVEKVVKGALAGEGPDGQGRPAEIEVEMLEGGPVVVWRGANGKEHRVTGRRGPIAPEDGAWHEDDDGIDVPPRGRAGWLRAFRGRGEGRDQRERPDEPRWHERIERLEQENRELRGQVQRLQHQMARLMGDARDAAPRPPMPQMPQMPPMMGPVGPGTAAPRAPRGVEDRLERIERLLERLVGQAPQPGQVHIQGQALPAIRLQPALGALDVRRMPAWLRLEAEHDAPPSTPRAAPAHGAKRRQEIEDRLRVLRERLDELQRLEDHLDAQDDAKGSK